LSGAASNGCPRNRITRIRSKTQPPWLSHPRRCRGTLEELDQDNDGRISRSEWQRNEQAFDRMDADKDGFLTKEELRSAAREFREKRRSRLEEMDADADGNISRSEWKGKEEIIQPVGCQQGWDVDSR
jgi:Ca2+-binding EF-hand superfamily protein